MATGLRWRFNSFLPFDFNWQSNGRTTNQFDVDSFHRSVERRRRRRNRRSVFFFSTDLQEKSRYLVKIRAKNQLGFSNFSNQFIVTTLDSPIPVEQYPQIVRAYFAVDGRRIRFQLNEMRSTSVGKDQWCLQYYSPPSGQVETEDETLTCVPLTSLPTTTTDEFEITPTEEHSQVRLRLCLINQTDLCSKSSAIPTGMPLVNDSSELILILIGKDFGSICSGRRSTFSPL